MAHSTQRTHIGDMTYRIASNRDRLCSAGGAALLVAAIGYGLVAGGLVAGGLAAGLGVDVRAKIGERFKVVSLLPDTPPPKPDPVPARRQAEKRKEGTASPPNLKSKATELVAPVPSIVIRQPAPIAVATIAGPGLDRSTGAAPVAGPGTGNGGQGNGLGSGADGDGGGGGGGGGGSEAELVSNRLRYRDLPRDLWDVHAAGTVTYRATIGVDGRLSDCRIARSSGDARLDAATCALALRHVRFRPARDEHGRKVADAAIFEQEWTVERRAGAEPEDGR